ncbi:MAG: DUF5689 domain-containing protein, partial [Flavobacteriaceae bacterium]
MKTINLKNYLLALLASVAIVSCVQDDEFSVPESVGAEENENLNTLLKNIDLEKIQLVSIDYVKGLYNGQVTLIESNLAVKGYVSSSDATGNFYKEFYIQDAPE